MQAYATYAKFYAPEEAETLISLLKQNEIPYAMEHEVNQLDRVYIGESPDPMFALRIPANKFPDANGVLARQARIDMGQPGFAHQMQSYSPEELKEILENPEGWSAYDLEVAKSLFGDREPLAEPVKAETYEPATVKRQWIIAGYLLCLTGIIHIAFFYFALGGFFAGISILQAKKTLKDGTTVHQYAEADRSHGRRMMFLSILFLVLGFVIFIYSRSY